VWEHAKAHEGPTARDAAQACLALHEGDSARAERFALVALRGADLASSPGPVIDTLEVLACTAERRGGRERAAQLRAALVAARVRERYGRLTAEDEAFGPPHQEAASSRTRPLPDVVAAVLHGRRRRGEATAGWSSLTATERHVVHLLLEGRSNARIAAEMRISVPTVKSHLTHIYTKLGVASRLELAQRAASDPPPWNPPTFG
jgi:DNA-binding CsgD family transcriptional regulator